MTVLATRSIYTQPPHSIPFISFFFFFHLLFSPSNINRIIQSKFRGAYLPYLDNCPLKESPQNQPPAHFAWLIWRRPEIPNPTELVNPEWRPYSTDQAMVIEQQYQAYKSAPHKPAAMRVGDDRFINFEEMIETRNGGAECYKIARVWYRWWWKNGSVPVRFNPEIEDLLELRYVSRECTEMFSAAGSTFLVNFVEMAEFKCPGFYSRYELKREGSDISRHAKNVTVVNGTSMKLNIGPAYWNGARPWDNTTILPGTLEWDIISLNINRSICFHGRK